MSTSLGHTHHHRVYYFVFVPLCLLLAGVTGYLLAARAWPEGVFFLLFQALVLTLAYLLQPRSVATPAALTVEQVAALRQAPPEVLAPLLEATLSEHLSPEQIGQRAQLGATL